MKRLIGAGLLALALGVVAAPALAIPAQDFGQLAAYYPDTTTVYVSFRTDSGYIAELDPIFERITAETGAQPTNLSQALDAFVAQANLGGDSFESAVGSWLGDTAAYGQTDTVSFMEMQRGGNDAPQLLALSVTDPQAASDWLQGIYDRGPGLIASEGDGYTEYTVDDAFMSNPPIFRVTSDALLIANSEDAFVTGGTLADSADFTDALASLPNDSYNIAAYLALGDILASDLAARMDMLPSQGLDMPMMTAMQDAFGSMAIGFTILNGNTLNMDTTIAVNTEAVSQMPAVDMSAWTPVTDSLASRVPASASVAIFSSDLAREVQQSIDSWDAALSYLDENPMMEGPRADELRAQLDQLNLGLQSAVGLTLDSLFSWATGQYVIAGGLDLSAFPNGLNSDPTRNPFGFSVVIENVDGGAQNLYDGVATLLSSLGAMPRVSVTEKDITGGQALNVSVEQPRGPQIDLQMAITGDIFVIGTPDYVEAALANDGGLGAGQAFQNAWATNLDGSMAFLYADFADTLQGVGSRMGRLGGSDAEMLRLMSALVESMNISAATGVDMSSIITRMGITLTQ